jgi:predicted dehydrogenase
MLLAAGILKFAIDKPLTESVADAMALIADVRAQGGVVHSIDHYAHKGAAFNWLLGKREGSQYIRSLDDANLDEMHGALSRIGEIYEIEGTIVQDGGTDGRKTVEKSGVTVDLVTHLAAVTHSFGMLENIMVERVNASTYDPQSSLWRKVKELNHTLPAEMYVQASMRDKNGVNIVFTAGKMHGRTDIKTAKNLIIRGERGVATLDFDTTRAEIRMHSGEKMGVHLAINPYRLTFREARLGLAGEANNHIEDALAAIGLVEMIKQGYSG